MDGLKRCHIEFFSLLIFFFLFFVETSWNHWDVGREVLVCVIRSPMLGVRVKTVWILGCAVGVSVELGLG